MADDSVTQKKIMVVPEREPWGKRRIWQIQLINGESITACNTASEDTMTVSLVKEAMQHYIDVSNKAEHKDSITGGNLDLINTIKSFMDVEDIEIKTDSSKWLHSFGYVE